MTKPLPARSELAHKPGPNTAGRSDDTPLNLLRKSPRWFKVAAVVGIVIRLHFALFTQGTYDINIWTRHAQGIQQRGLLNHYRADEQMNHPPFIAVVVAGVYKVAQASNIPFRVLWRLSFALLDAATAILLLFILSADRNRFIIAACYWLHPLAMIFSAYHGNTDSSIAFFLILCVYLISKGNVAWAGAAIGASLWVKLPGMLAIPAFFFWLPSWRQRLKFILVAGSAAVLTYLPVLLTDPAIIYNRVFGYGGQIIQTTAGVPVWGTRIFLDAALYPNSPGYSWVHPLVESYYQYNVPFCLAAIVVISWLRAKNKSVADLCTTIAAVYTVLYGFSNYWSFQYFAWSLPFWLLTGAYYAVPASVLAGAYIYGLYWFVCGNPLLLGEWDFVGHPYWPTVLQTVRNLAVLFFAAAATAFFIAAAWRRIAILLSVRFGIERKRCASPHKGPRTPT